MIVIFIGCLLCNGCVKTGQFITLSRSIYKTVQFNGRVDELSTYHRVGIAFINFFKTNAYKSHA